MRHYYLVRPNVGIRVSVPDDGPGVAISTHHGLQVVHPDDQLWNPGDTMKLAPGSVHFLRRDSALLVAEGLLGEVFTTGPTRIPEGVQAQDVEAAIRFAAHRRDLRTGGG